jgi:lipopolysaccharide biosynthesis protein
MTSAGSDERRRGIRSIAFYLPQFHPIAENDAWWGKGFTEWTNVTRARPLFRGHDQPRLPADLGYYDLRCPETRLAQAEMAQAHGIEGFCYWHYWFAGDRLLERPFNDVLESGEPRFPFCLAWANDSWSGVWHGAPGRILKEQTYPGMEDHRRHFSFLLKAFSDSRYICVDGKPLFVIYRPQRIPDARRVTDYWRDLARDAGLKGLFLVAVVEENVPSNPADSGFDAVTTSNHARIVVVGPRAPWKRRLRFRVTTRPEVQALYARMGRPSRVHWYREAMELFLSKSRLPFDHFPCVIPGWDNTPRCGAQGLVLRGSTPELFQQHTREAFETVAHLPPERRIVFVKSWNEWAEGNYMEPDRRFGDAYLRAFRAESDAAREPTVIRPV